LTERKRAAVLCAGGAVQDIVMRVAAFPKAGHKVQASDYVVTIGGQSGNAAVAVARLGAEALYAGTLGAPDDPVAGEIVAALEKEGVDCSGTVRVPGAKSSVSLIMLDAEGEKMIATRRDSGLNDAKLPHIPELVARADAVLADNRYPLFAVPVCKAARSRGIPRVLDFDKPTGFDDELLLLSTHVVASADAAREATGEHDLKAALKKMGQHLDCFLAITDGPAGYYWLDGGEVRHAKAFKVDVVDTLGAGDVFHGAFTLRLAETGDEVEAMRFASAAAAIKCTRFGGTTGAATREEVETFLARNPATY
jgi:sugar/nucleoside kinase (ribokinase family)